MKPYILVVGSSNTDMVVRSPRLPMPGETILGGQFIMAAGGKGANQAVSAARLGAAVVLIAKVGEDVFGRQAVEGFEREGIDTSCVIMDVAHPSGIALITVDAHGENCIVVASGANAQLLPGDLTGMEDRIKQAAWILMQLEIPLETVEFVAGLAAMHGIPVILNPAPARMLRDELMRGLAVLAPNQKEAEMLSGVTIAGKASAERAAATLAAKGVRTVIITLGAEGALVHDRGEILWVAAPAVSAVDTTAAGDVFCGALATALSAGRRMKDAVEFACAAAALSVTRLGAQPSAPSLAAVEDFKARL